MVVSGKGEPVPTYNSLAPALKQPHGGGHLICGAGEGTNLFFPLFLSSYCYIAKWQQEAVLEYRQGKGGTNLQLIGASFETATRWRGFHLWFFLHPRLHVILIRQEIDEIGDEVVHHVGLVDLTDRVQVDPVLGKA